MIDVSLVMFKSDGTRKDFPIKKERVVIGRMSSCDLRIPLSSVSREHCEVLVNGSNVMFNDMGSSNGTYHNGVRVRSADLFAGDMIVIGPVVFIVTLDGQPENIDPVRTILSDDNEGSKANNTQNMSSDEEAPLAFTDEEMDGQGTEVHLDSNGDDFAGEGLPMDEAEKTYGASDSHEMVEPLSSAEDSLDSVDLSGGSDFDFDDSAGEMDQTVSPAPKVAASAEALSNGGNSDDSFGFDFDDESEGDFDFDEDDDSGFDFS